MAESYADFFARTRARTPRTLATRDQPTTFKPFMHANGGICCSNEHALCESCKRKLARRKLSLDADDNADSRHAARTNTDDYTPVDPYAADIEKLRRSNDDPSTAYPTKSDDIPVDQHGIPDPYFNDIQKLRRREK